MLIFKSCIILLILALEMKLEKIVDLKLIMIWLEFKAYL